jgi:hypothetical protein
MALNPKIWGPHYWFVLHTITLQYPTMPNETTKKKYYDFIQNLPLFIPNPEIGNQFAEYLDKYPVTPYLDSRESFIKWMNFIHNKVNIKLGKPILSIEEGIHQYYEEYKPKQQQNMEERRKRNQIIFGSISAVGLLLAYYLYTK